MSDPLEDFNARKLLLQAGVVLASGQAARILDEVSPLLAAEGIDLHGTAPLDIHAFRTAVIDALERIKLERFTPVGLTRAHALTLVGAGVLAICAADSNGLNQLVERIELEPRAAGQASTSHVIGATLGKLDTWHTDPARAASVANTRTSTINTGLTNAVREVLARAGTGHAFSSVDTLILRHGSLTLLVAGLFAATAVLASWAETEGTDIDELVERLVADRI